MQVLLFAVMPLAVLGFVAWIWIIPSARQDVELRHQTLARAMEGQIETHLKTSRRELLAVGHILNRWSPHATADQDAVLDAVVGDGELYEVIYLLNQQGMVRALGLPSLRRSAREDLRGVDMSRGAFIQIARDQGQPVWSDSFLSVVSGRLTVAIAIPMAEGVLVGEIALEHLSHYLLSLPSDESITALVIDRQSHLIAHPKAGMAGQQLNLSSLALVKEGFLQRKATGSIDFNGQSLLGSAVLVDGVNWLLIIAESPLNAFRFISLVSWSMLGGSLFSLLFSIAFGLFLTRQMSRRIESLSFNVGEMGAGRYDLNWPVPFSRELASLSAGMQLMAKDIQQREADLLRSEACVHELVQFTSELVIRMDATGRLLFVNHAAWQVYGLPPEQCLGLLAFDFVHPDDQISTMQAFSVWLQSGEDMLQLENRQMSRQGQVFVIAWSTHAHRDSHGQIVEFSSIGHDLTEIRRSEAENRMLALVASSTTSAVVITDADRRVEWMNAAYCRLTGYSEHELLGQRPNRLLHGPDTNPVTLAYLRRRLHAGESVRQVELLNYRKNGTPYWVEIEIQPVRDIKGELSRFIAIETDVTARRAIALALQASEERLRATLENTPNIAVQWYDGAGRVIYWNHSSSVLYGISAEQAAGKKMGQLLVDTQHAAQFESVLQEVQQSGKAVGPYEVQLVRADGVQAALLCTTFSIPDNEGGAQFVNMDVDISAQKNAASTLLQREKRYRALIEQSPLAVIEWDLGFCVSEWNAAAERIFGYAREDALGKHATFVMGNISVQGDDALRAFLLNEGVAERRESQIFMADGRCIDCQWYNQPVLNEHGHVFAFLSLVDDVTERKHIEQEIRELNQGLELRVAARTQDLECANVELRSALATLERAKNELVHSGKLAALGSLVAGVAHELNTPIGNSLMAATTLVDHNEDFQRVLASGKLRKSTLEQFGRDAAIACDIVVRNLGRAGELVASFKQVAVDQASSQRRRFNLQDVVAEILLTLGPTLRKSPFVVLAEIPDELLFDSYPGPLGQILTNLINNALVHAFEGREGGRIRIFAHSLNSSQVNFGVEDNGVGIAEANLPHIFDPFFTTKLGKGGSGLGLNIVHNVVTGTLGGRVEVKTSPQGTCFILTLPVCAPAISASSLL